MEFISPSTEQHWQCYYQLRYQVLRAPWQQPAGSERDDSDATAFHLMAIDNDGCLAVGRVHMVDENVAQVRYMAVAEHAQGQYLASHLLMLLQRYAQQQGASLMRLHARDSALGFYQKAGYRVVEPSHLLFGEIQHYLLEKSLVEPTAHWLVANDSLQALQHTWHNTIPLSSAMQLRIGHYTGREFATEAPLSANINLHGTMFAGSIYCLATLAGWGALQIAVEKAGVAGDLVLAHGDIHYKRPLRELPRATVDMTQLVIDFAPLAQGRNVKVPIDVNLYSGDELVAKFTGKYAVLPKAH